jgi:hypothetical protein
MASEIRSWTRQGEAFWLAHHEAWKRSYFSQRQYCETEVIPLKAFGFCGSVITVLRVDLCVDK